MKLAVGGTSSISKPPQSSSAALGAGVEAVMQATKAGVEAAPDAAMPEFSPAGNRDDLAKTARFLRRRKDAELTQIIASPAALVDWLPGYTAVHLGTADERVAVDLAKDELSRRSARRMRRVSWLALWVSIFSAAAAIASAVTAVFTHFAHR